MKISYLILIGYFQVCVDGNFVFHNYFPCQVMRAKHASLCILVQFSGLSIDPRVCVSSACIGAQDPYCGWDAVMKKCTSLEESLSMTQWEQTIAACPVSVCVLGPLHTLSTVTHCALVLSST